jgi:CubicO group peptidase (beta-lactamase class C family)
LSIFNNCKTIAGEVDPQFELVKDVFESHFSGSCPHTIEVGAAIAVYFRGHCVVNLWGGWKDRDLELEWAEDTMVNVFSTTKGFVAILMAQLYEQCLIDYDMPVVELWPEFKGGGKEKITIAQVMSHQAGLPGFTRPTTISDLYDWGRIINQLETQDVQFEPGTDTCYHALTYGFLAGEIIRRVTGNSVGGQLQKCVAEPLSANMYIGVPEGRDSQVARLYRPEHRLESYMASEDSVVVNALNNPRLDPDAPNTREWRQAEIPGANGHASAMGVARLYGALANAGQLNNQAILKTKTINKMVAVQSARRDRFIGATGNWCLGLTRNYGRIFGPNKDTVGHPGWGGAFGCADLTSGLSIGYVCNQMGSDIAGDSRAKALSAAVLSCVSG